MTVRNARGHFVRDDEIARYILERHNAVLRALVERGMPETAIYLSALDEAAEAIPTLDKQRGVRAGDTPYAITGSAENAGEE